MEKEIKFVYFQDWGCSANQNNTEIMKGLVMQAGLELTTEPKIADIIVLNTCIVKEPTEKEIERKISDLEKLKKPIIIAGCMPDVRHDKFKNMKNIYLLSNKNTKQITNLIKAISEDSYELDDFIMQKNEEKLCLPKLSGKKKIGITQISEGCRNSCSFCITRFAKGKLFSYSKEKIIKNIQQDLESGCKEIWLTSQDNASYGLDRGKAELPELMREILKLGGKFRLRIGMMNPENVLLIIDDLVEIYKNEKVYKFLHIPIQSGSDSVLEMMNRKYKIEDAEKIINNLRKEIPEMTFSTDIIVGFPGETEKDFEKSLDLVKRFEFESLNVSKYWAMDGTPAAKMKQVDFNVSKERAIAMMEQFKKTSKEKNRELIGKYFRVLVNDFDKKTRHYISRTDNYRLVKIQSEKDILGKFVNVKITRIMGNGVVGELITLNHNTSLLFKIV